MPGNWLQDFFFGTFAPFFLASERPMAMACFRLFTLPPFPLLPEVKVPFLLRRTALATLLPADLPYFRVLLPALFFLPLELFFAGIFFTQNRFEGRVRRWGCVRKVRVFVALFSCAHVGDIRMRYGRVQSCSARYDGNLSSRLLIRPWADAFSGASIGEKNEPESKF